MDNSGYNLPETTRIFFCIPHKISVNFLSKSKRKFVEKETIRDMSRECQLLKPRNQFRLTWAFLMRFRWCQQYERLRRQGVSCFNLYPTHNEWVHRWMIPFALLQYIGENLIIFAIGRGRNRLECESFFSCVNLTFSGVNLTFSCVFLL